MKQEGLKERVELLEAGEQLGYPRLGYGRSTKIPHDKRIPQGKDGWERFASHAHIRRIYPALRIARVLRDNHVQVFHPLTAAEIRLSAIDVPEGMDGRVVAKQITETIDRLSAAVEDLLEDIVVDKTEPEIAPPNTNPTVTVGTPRRKKGGHKRRG